MQNMILRRRLIAAIEYHEGCYYSGHPPYAGEDKYNYYRATAFVENGKWRENY